MTVDPSPKVAVLMNGASALHADVEACFKNAIHAIDPTAIIDTYDPIVAQTYPEQSTYDLVILSGGGTDPMSQEPWVLKMQEFIRSTIIDHPAQKLLGICWGHQTISVSLGGVVGPMEAAELGVHTIPLTDTGSQFFSSVLPSSQSYDILEFHAREIRQPGKGLIALAGDNQCFVNASNTVLTFQGHPELTEAFGKKMLPGATKSYMRVKESELDLVGKGFEKPHDGHALWKRILMWVKE
ncbi:copper iron-regulated glutamine amidotransferase [Phlyctema vagabunda]|uniref:Copper iron-regulated glutamine amidotransferase n=1 Tax=Phlyctema vagabunda TaxID=108571 RepID=A0ABR4P883_9HELO